MRSCVHLAAILLAGCVTPNPIEFASEREVMVNRADMVLDGAAKLAEQRFSRKGKRAVFKARVTSFSNAYECVQ